MNRGPPFLISSLLIRVEKPREEEHVTAAKCVERRCCFSLFTLSRLISQTDINKQRASLVITIKMQTQMKINVCLGGGLNTADA